jgi:uncharacterized protein YggT (Ycf19 family)
MWLLLLSILKSNTKDKDSLRQLLRVHLGRVEAWPAWLKVLLPVFVIAPSWWLASWPLTQWRILPDPASATRRMQQALLVATGSYLSWRYLMVGLLALYFVSSYVYFGRHSFWKHLDELAQQLLKPLRWLPSRIGRIDLLPLFGVAIILLFAHVVENGAPRRFDRAGKELPRRIEIPGLVDLYRRVSR